MGVCYDVVPEKMLRIGLLKGAQLLQPIIVGRIFAENVGDMSWQWQWVN